MHKMGQKKTFLLFLGHPSDKSKGDKNCIKYYFQKMGRRNKATQERRKTTSPRISPALTWKGQPRAPLRGSKICHHHREHRPLSGGQVRGPPPHTTLSQPQRESQTTRTARGCITMTIPCKRHHKGKRR